MYVYVQSEKPCKDNNFCSFWTVGFYDPSGKWNSESDHNEREHAAKRVALLNGAAVNA